MLDMDYSTFVYNFLNEISGSLYRLYNFCVGVFKKITTSIIYFFSQRKESKPVITSQPSIVTQTEQYVKSTTDYFLKTYDKRNATMNANMDDVFYHIEEYNSIIKSEHSDFEKKWRARVLYENTPRGNIIMYYDAYKKGFAYYSDTKGIPYNVLNSVAMKYVRIFLCRDLFVDEKITPESSPSPLIKLQEEEEKKESETKKEKKGVVSIDKEILKKAPFAKLKNYKMEEKKDEKSKLEPLKIVSVNRFIFMGKQCEYPFIQRIPKPKVGTLKIGKTAFSDLFEKEHDLQVETMSYKDFKKALSTKA